jgi:hypothetical protein
MTKNVTQLRWPEGLRAAVVAAAAANRRSMNSEILARLENSFAPCAAPAEQTQEGAAA